MKSWLVAALLVAAISVPVSAQQRTRLQVYSTLEVENIGDFKKAFEIGRASCRERVSPRV